jgi:2-polyprenyl-3-methyl-5-hydroxy-6-metoxy-1,4-benzoquinol methylase
MRAVYQQDDYFEAASGDPSASVGYGHYASQADALRLTFRRFLQALKARGLTGGDLLEVGCGPGLLLDEARPHFARREGCEFSPAAARTARALADAVHAGGVEALPAGACYDCIIATQVVEHVYDPRAFVQALVTHLRPGGVLVLATPDHGSLWRRAMGRRWPSYKLPEHVLYFDATTLGRLMTECGVRDLQPVPYPHAFPLSLVASKLGLRWTGPGADRSLWIPGTTLALAGRRAEPND